MNLISAIIIHYSNMLHFDPMITLAVIRQETNFNNDSVGLLGEVGIMQVRPEFIKEYNKKELRQLEVNVKVGIELLKEAKEKCIHKKELDWVICFNRGIAGGNKVKNPSLDKYVINATKYYKEYKEEKLKWNFRFKELGM